MYTLNNGILHNEYLYILYFWVKIEVRNFTCNRVFSYCESTFTIVVLHISHFTYISDMFVGIMVLHVFFFVRNHLW